MCIQNEATKHKHRSVRTVAYALFAAGTTLASIAQVQTKPLSDGLVGKEVGSLIMIGHEGAPVGYSAPYPVNTLVYPDGQIIYKVEIGIMRAEVGRMQTSFVAGTMFRISAVDIKNDRLELKLAAREGGNGRLKVMLGPAWQTELSNAGVANILAKYIVLPESIKQVSAEAAAPISSATVSPSGSQVAYSRPSGSQSLPERPSEAEIQRFLSGLGQKQRLAEQAMRQANAVFAQAFRAFESVYGRERGVRVINDIAVLRNQLGSDFVPRSDEDIAELASVYGRCLETDNIRGASINGQDVGPGSNSAAYRRSFPGGDIGAHRQKATDDLRGPFDAQAILKRYEAAILENEKALDTGDYSRAMDNFQKMQTYTPPAPEVQQYVSAYSAMRQDITAYLAASKTERASQEPLLAALRQVISESHQINDTGNKPLAAPLLRTNFQADKQSVEQRLNALPPFLHDQASQKLVDSATQSSGKPESADVLKAHSAELSRMLTESDDLKSVLSDKALVDDIRSMYGMHLYESLLQKGKGIAEAESLRIALDVKAAEIDESRRKLAADREAAAAQRRALGGNIVNQALLTTKLEEEFRTKQLMGYQMEANKARRAFIILIRDNRVALDAGGWADVDRAYQQVLPGLTVFEARYMQGMLNSLRH
jgi:hypothetical protein